MLHLVGAVAVAHVLDSISAVCDGCRDFVSMGDGRLHDALVEELRRVVETLNVRSFYVASMCVMVFRRRC